jgi:GNAT superfamily N-acetyltransferase
MYRKGDETQIVELLDLLFDGWPHFDLNCASIDHWRWKYQDNPFKRFIITVAVTSKKIVGVVHTHPLNIKIGDEPYFCTFGGDTGVHPDFRRRGIHKQLSAINNVRKKEAGSQYHYLITGNPIVIKSFLKTRNLFPYKMSKRIRIRDISLHLLMNPREKAWMVKLAFNNVKRLNYLSNIFGHSIISSKNINISKISRFDNRISEFWKQISEHYNFILVRNPDYLNWRYSDFRGGNYVINIAEENGNILGYIILRINRYRKDYSIGVIVDFLTIPKRSDAAHALMAEAVNYFDSQDVNIVQSLVVKNHPLEKIHKMHGFLDSRESPHIFYLRYGTQKKLSIPKTNNPQKGAHFVYGDTDVI